MRIIAGANAWTTSRDRRKHAFGRCRNVGVALDNVPAHHRTTRQPRVRGKGAADETCWIRKGGTGCRGSRSAMGAAARHVLIVVHVRRQVLQTEAPQMPMSASF